MNSLAQFHYKCISDISGNLNYLIPRLAVDHCDVFVISENKKLSKNQS